MTDWKIRAREESQGHEVGYFMEDGTFALQASFATFSAAEKYWLDHHPTGRDECGRPLSAYATQGERT